MGRLLLFIVLPLLVVVSLVTVMLTRSLPRTDGTLTVAGLEHDVRIERDASGVPHIQASSEHDAFFAMGYAHAQDRLWQMDFRRRLGSGRLSEILGKDSLATDKLMRTLGLYRSSQAALAALTPADRDALRAYADGVNAWIGADLPLPPEYYYFGIRPEPWAEADSLLMIKLLALSLGGNYKEELANQILVKHLGSKRASELLGKDFSAPPTELSAALSGNLHALVASAEARGGLAGVGVGSNAWAVSGRLTASGKPLLAGDPHLRVQLPTTFYLADIDAGDLHVSGATLPGLPVVVFGHNRDIAWTGTNLEADVQDLYVEHTSIDKEQYETADGWRAFDVHDEWIKVAPAFPASLREPYRPIRWRVRSAVQGPLISDVFGAGDNEAVALRWTALDPDDTSFGSFLAINRARNLDQFRAALKGFVAPALAFVYADSAGHVAMLAAGRIPIRGQGRGMLPSPGWVDAYAWKGSIDNDQLPSVIDPASGMVVSANQRFFADDYPYSISTSWQPEYRAQRITAMLQALVGKGHRIEPADFARIQQDTLDTQAGELLPFLRRQQGRDGRERDAITQLAHWDGDMALDSVGASIYYAWSRHFMRRLVEGPLRVEMVNGQWLDTLRDQSETFEPAFLKRVVSGELPDWCSVGDGACDQVALTALDDALAELGRLDGRRMTGWQWGDMQQLILPHTPFTASPFLSTLFDRRSPVAGGRYSVNVSMDAFSEERGYVKVLGAAYRQIVPLADPAASRFVLDAGQSGNVIDAHYVDMRDIYSRGEYVRLDRGATGQTRVLLLKPVGEVAR
ncbi:penicillin acylase family protein [Luteibacter sp. dw_328]|uniref:penicillin acylase family protein n=1 Tax=Luteibacter sp. dw_328 TaxID=2719796 RepID=UPI001BD3481E|nr:penicillin acylase family protein [Luteibacter sp. dw_328]